MEKSDISTTDSNNDSDAERKRRQFLQKFWFKALKAKHVAYKREKLGKSQSELVSNTTITHLPKNPVLSLRFLLTQEERENRISVSNKEAAVNALLQHGVCCLDGAVKKKIIGECFAKALEKSMFLFNIIKKKVASDNTWNSINDVKCAEIVCRSPLRFDVILDIWRSIIKSLLGPACYLVKTGVVISMPGSTVQELNDKNTNSLPPHCLTVFIPLIDVSSKHGPTNYFIGTHKNQKNDHCLNYRIEKGMTPKTFSSEIGSVIIHDYRTLHYGGANETSEIRPLLYMTYARSWFRDYTNYPKVSLFEKDRVDDTQIDKLDQ